MEKLAANTTTLHGKIVNFAEDHGIIQTQDGITYPIHISALQNASHLRNEQRVTFEVKTLSDGHKMAAFVNVV